MRYKKGSILDNVWAALQLFGFALFLLVIAVVWANLSTSEMDENLWDKTTVGTDAKADAQGARDSFDLIFMIVYFGLHLGILALAYMMRNHPIMYVAIIFIVAILVVVAAPLSNVWEEVKEDTDFASASTDLVKTDYIMRHFPLFEMIWAFVTAVVLLGVSRID